MQLESVGFGEYAGLDWARLGARVTLTNLGGFFAEPVAESALAGILALLRGVDRLVALKTQRVWLGDDLRDALRTLHGASVVLFGYGSINRRLAELLAPFRCEVVPFSSTWTATDLDAALARADVVVCTAPDTPATRAVFGRERLGLLGPSTLFANFGRGSLVDEAALAEALEGGRLGGAVIDVTRAEPLPPEHPLWTCPNTQITMHLSGIPNAASRCRAADRFLRNCALFREGKPLEAQVDLRRGY